MAMTDPVADMLSRIRNAARRRHVSVQLPASKLKAEVARVLNQEGFVGSIQRLTEAGHPVLRVRLRYQEDEAPMITGLRRISRPGKRVYVRHSGIPVVMRGMGVAVISTPKGVMTGADARAQRIGGEILCFVW
jgi:small subunit ribosomal protein S8